MPHRVRTQALTGGCCTTCWKTESEAKLLRCSACSHAWYCSVVGAPHSSSRAHLCTHGHQRTDSTWDNTLGIRACRSVSGQTSKLISHSARPCVPIHIRLHCRASCLPSRQTTARFVTHLAYAHTHTHTHTHTVAGAHRQAGWLPARHVPQHRAPVECLECTHTHGARVDRHMTDPAEMRLSDVLRFTAG